MGICHPDSPTRVMVLSLMSRGLGGGRGRPVSGRQRISLSGLGRDAGRGKRLAGDEKIVSLVAHKMSTGLSPDVVRCDCWLRVVLLRALRFPLTCKTHWHIKCEEIDFLEVSVFDFFLLPIDLHDTNSVYKDDNFLRRLNKHWINHALRLFSSLKWVTLEVTPVL